MIVEFGKFLVQFLTNSYELVVPFKICDEGYVFIRKTLGKPQNKICKTGLHFKWPFFQTFDKIDIRKQVFNGNAHSFKCRNKFWQIIPTNTLIDYIVTYKIINPYVIYHVNINDSEIYYRALSQAVCAKVHEMLKELNDKQCLSYKNCSIFLNDKIKEINKEKNYKQLKIENKYSENVLDYIKIESVAVTSFDDNLSHRNSE